MPIVDSVAANVESTLSYNLAGKLVRIASSWRSSSNSGNSRDPRDATLFLCIGILFLCIAPRLLLSSSATSANPSKKSSSLKTSTLAMATEVFLIAFSKIVMQQVRLSQFQVDPLTPPMHAVFLYMQRVLEITFVGVIMSCCLATFLPETLKQKASSAASAPNDATPSSLMLAGKQMNSIVVNMQRSFADTVAALVPDAQTRKMVVMLGLCLLPSISSGRPGGSSGSSSKHSDLKAMESFFFFLASNPKKEEGAEALRRKQWRAYAKVLAKICVTGITMAWINTALGFILPSSPSGQNTLTYNTLQACVRLVGAACLAILTRALQPMFPGIGVFQGYIEWSVASSTTAYLGQLSSSNSPMLVVVCSGLAFYAADVMLRDVSSDHDQSLASTLQTLQSVTIIMFTNSLVDYAMLLASASSSSNGRSSSVQQDLATVAAGLVAARTVMQIIESYTAGH